MATRKYFSEINEKTTPVDADIYLLADSEDLSSGNPIHKKITHENVRASLIIDEDTLASNLDTKAPTQQSVKSYVDTGLATKAETSHTHTASQITDFDTEVANNSVVSANTAKTSFPGFGTLASDYSVTLATVATSGEYSDLSGKPTIPTALADLDTTVTGTQLNAIKTKTDHITVTQAVDLDQMETDIASLANGMVYKGDWDASAGTFPGAGSAQTGRFYYVSVGGTVDSVEFVVGDNIVATTDDASSTTYAANWSKHDQTDAVQSVVGLFGSISKSSLLAAINVEDGADVTDAANVGSTIHGSSGKTTPVDADAFGLIDSAASNVLKNVTWANIKATIKSWYDSVTSTLTNKTLALGSNTVSGTKAEFDTACSDDNFIYEDDIGTSVQAYDADTTKNDVANTFTALQTMDDVKIASNKHVYFNAVTDNGNSSTADTIDWGAGNIQKSTLTGNCTYTFTAPDGPGNYQLIVIQDATGSRTVTRPASVKRPGGTAPTLTTTADATDIISFLYDGTSYFGVDVLALS